MTLSEVLLWNQLKNGQMLNYDFHRQKPILNYIVDFYCAELKLIIEVDGFSHDFKMDKDKTRENELKKYGLNILRFQDIEIKSNLDNVLKIIYDWVAQHPPTPLIRGD
jgi:very-short-patch-repair endonuclease